MTNERLRSDAGMSEWDEAYDDQKTFTDGHTISGFLFGEPLGNVPRRTLLVVQASDSVGQTIRAMNERHVGCALVIRDERLAGIFTERDVLTKVAASGLDHERTRVEQIMTADPATLPASAPIGFALRHMTDEGYRHIPLVDDQGRPLGVVAVRDIVAWLVEFLPTTIANLPPEPGVSHRLDGG
jgi:CBS domain-containing protein